jgi:hypothetical protein
VVTPVDALIAGTTARSDMSTVRRQLAVVAGALLLALLPSAVIAQQDGGFGTERQVVEGDVLPDGVVVTDARVASLAGFDRITFDVAGDALASVEAFYDDPAILGEDAPDLPGDATLRVIVTNALIPPEAPQGVETFLDDVAGPEGGVITEISNGGDFEGRHVFVVGVTQQVPFRVQRLEDPQRVVVDIVNDAPVGGVATGLGGTADTGPLVSATAFGLAVALALAGAGILVRRSRR